MKRRHAAVARAVGNAHALFAARADNAELWDVEGRRYLDFCAGIAVVNTGHRHPKVMAALAAQAERFTHTCFQVVAYDGYVQLAERLCQLAPGASPKKAFFMSTGAEAIENAVKIARHATGRDAVIAFEGAFHGRTQLGMALTGKVAPYKLGFGPLGADIYHVPFPSAVHGVSVDDSLRAIQRLFRYHVDPARVAALLVEPVQGEGGYLPAPPGFLAALRALCDQHGMVFIADEIQTGIGRAGKLFAVEHFGVEPDLITLAKGLGGGTPISAVVGKAGIIDQVPAGGLGSTYAGHPLACAAALAVLDAMESENLCARSLQLGERLRARLGDMARQHRSIGDIRGLGAMTAVEFFKGGDKTQPATELAAALKTEAARRGLLLLTCGSFGNAIRVMVPLTIPFDQLDEGLDIFAQALAAVDA
ncbi:4-aminobutyrate--2-oxoglutarate transaminase [Ottowia sp.]|uniref:4-aminobutyrate--2-oxoglutarate transaminase n=1 Tax=Ottowia sp. TaxID=1898956 RepID=UPI002B843F34|nr:4-aminobutyrate--2-oxoglutarate transaminase [Ottowia sp.]HOB67705.1 4-aminobutyrate--2-oxoglutarate transaminase [Ottowia sp.]HPZ58338.1 4-aminobutyrate--2-oxoglutarate transaminase [Ottowia sp.]HQD48585.1 4-aminobutyrate--2-oxoglutarate transaminase [Ottowia sp.]